MKNRFYKALVFIGFTVWVLESWYFGWNREPINAQEHFMDLISQTAILWGLIGDIATNLTITKTETNNINTKNVIINGKPVINTK